MEPDCAFYLGERTRDFRAACAEGVEAAEAFIEATAPDLVVEVEVTNVDASKTDAGFPGRPPSAPDSVRCIRECDPRTWHPG